MRSTWQCSSLAWVAFLGALAACGGTQALEHSSEDTFGHRPEGVADGADETLVIEPGNAATPFAVAAAPHDTIHVRIEAGTDAQGLRRVELLVKGYLPDTCSDLHEVSQSRAGSTVDVSLVARRPEGAFCAAVVRPYRFYLLLDDGFASGSYTLRFNGVEQTFGVR